MSATKLVRNVTSCLATAGILLFATTASAQFPPVLHDNFIPWGDQPIYDGLSYMASHDVPNGTAWAADDATFAEEVVVVGIEWAGLRHPVYDYDAQVTVLTEAGGVFTEVWTSGLLSYDVLEDLGTEFGYDALRGYVELDLPLALAPGHYYFAVRLVSSGSAAFAGLLTTGGHLDPGGTGAFYPLEGAVFIDGATAPDGEWHFWTDYWLLKVGLTVPETDFAYRIRGGLDCNSNGIADYQDITDCAGDPACGDCNTNGVPDGCDIDAGTSLDCDSDGVPDECEADADTDGLIDDCDNCPGVYNPDQADADSDGLGDACDDCPYDPDNDVDTDGICGDVDNCPDVYNPYQDDTDSDGIGDACDAYPEDYDNDGIPDVCDLDENPGAEDCNSNGITDACDIDPTDPDGDGSVSADDNDNSIPDECEFPDEDGDGIPDDCDIDLHPEAEDCNSNGITDECEIQGLLIKEIPFEGFLVLDWQDSADDDYSEVIALPFPVTLGGETFVAFVQDSNGYVELLHEGEEAYTPSYGSVEDLTSAGDPTHTYLMAAYDDLDSSYGYYGYKLEADHVVYHWFTETHDDVGYSYLNEFQIILYDDGRVQWNFNFADYDGYGYDLFTGLYFGYDSQTLIEVTSGDIPAEESWQYTEAGGLVSIPFEFEGLPDLDWQDSTSSGEWSPVVALPFPVTLGGETFASFVQYSDGYVELLHDGEDAYYYGYGYAVDMTLHVWPVGEPTHTFLMAAYDELYSDYIGRWGYELEADHVVFFWLTETYYDDDDGLLNEFQIILHDDGCVQWNFNFTTYYGYDYDLFTGLYLGYDSQTLYEIIREAIPERRSWVFDEDGFFGGTATDCNTNGVPDECDIGAVGPLYTLPRTETALYTVDPDTGALTLAVDFVPPCEDCGDRTIALSYSPGGVLHALVSGEDGRDLITIDPATGDVTLIGQVPWDIDDMVFASDGTLYGVTGGYWLFSPGEIVTIDRLDATVTPTGIIGAPGWPQALAAVPGTSLLYHVAGGEGETAGSTLERIDTVTGEMTVISTLSDDQYRSLVWDSDGSRLLAAAGDWDMYPAEYGYLYAIDPDTGAETLIGETGRILEGLSFEPGSQDCDGNGIPDECDIADCDGDLACGDCDSDGIPDGCQYDLADCNTNGLPDGCEVALGLATDCNDNGVLDECDLEAGTSPDVNTNGIPDECEVDCNGDGAPDGWAIEEGLSPDCNSNGVPDDCDLANPVWYGATEEGGELYALDVETGATTLAFEVPGMPEGYWYGLPGLSVSPDGELHVLLVAQGGPSGYMVVFAADVQTGDVSYPVAFFDAGYGITDIAFTDDGTLYGVAGGWSETYLEPGEIVIIGGGSGGEEVITPTGIIGAPGIGQSIAARPGTSLLYHVSIEGLEVGKGEGDVIAYLEVIDVSTGEITPISDQLTRFYQALAWDAEHERLLGTSLGYLYAIDPDTGVETQLSFTGQVLGGLVPMLWSDDCNTNGIPDECDIADETSADINFNGVPDECEDCDGDGIPDDLAIQGLFIEEVPFEFEGEPALDWEDSADESTTDVEPLPFAVTLAGETFVAFQQDSNGYVELLRDGDTPEHIVPYMGYMGYVVDYGQSEHTYLFAGFDDLSSLLNGRFGFHRGVDRTTFYWNTETDCEAGSGQLSEFEIVLHSDGRVQWNFNAAASGGDPCHWGPLFSGLYLGREGTLIQLYDFFLPEHESWQYVPTDIVAPLPFEFTDSGDSLDWQASEDLGWSPEVALPFSVELGGETFVAFSQGSDGYVELLRDGESASGMYASYAGYVGYLMDATDHTHLLAAFNDLSSQEYGFYGYKLEAERAIFHWNTETACEAGAGDPSEFEVILHADGRVQWNFNTSNYTCYYPSEPGLYSGVLLGGWDLRGLTMVISEDIPEGESWLYTEPDPPASIPFEFVDFPGLDWQDAADDSYSSLVELPFAVTVGGETFVGFVQNANGYVELLRSDGLAYTPDMDAYFEGVHGHVSQLINWVPEGGGPTHTYLLAAYDNLDSSVYDLYGFKLWGDRVQFYWNTETDCDVDDGEPQLNEFEMILHADGRVQWNFNSADYICHEFDLFTGVYLGYGAQTLHEVISGEIPTQRSWRFTAEPILGGYALDCNGNGIPDACDLADCASELWCGDCNGNGVLDECDIGIIPLLGGRARENEIYLVDPLTGAATLLLEFEVDEQEPEITYDGVHAGIAYAPDGTLYVLGTEYDDLALESDYVLHTLDLDVGDWQPIGGFPGWSEVPGGYRVSDIAFTSDGTLYGVTGGDEEGLMDPGQLAIISTVDGSITPTDIFAAAGGGQSVAAVPGTSLLYHTASEGEGDPGGLTNTVLELIDVSTGDVTLISDALVHRYQALVYDPDQEQLFGASGSWHPYPEEHGSLFVIDPLTGAETYVGETSMVLAGLAFAPPVSEDCNRNEVPDECDVDPTDPDGDGWVSPDVDTDGIPDECADADYDGIPDQCDIDEYPEAEDCNSNGITDECDVDPDDPDFDGVVSEDCNTNGVPDECDLGAAVLLGGLRQDSELYAVDPATGALTLLLDFEPPLDDEIYGISLAPDGTLYVLGDTGDVYQLQTVDLETGDVAVIGEFSYDYPVADIAFTADGTLYGVYGNYESTTPGRLATISTVDATVTPTAIFGVPGSGQSIAAVPGTDFLYHTASTGDGHSGDPNTVLELIDVTDGSVTLISDTLATRYQSLAYEPYQDLLFGASGGLTPEEHGALYLIDPDTGAETYVGETGRVLGGLAFVTGFGASQDCNYNGVPDECDIADGTSADCDSDGVPDECEPDSDDDGLIDDCDPDDDNDGVPDECDADQQPDRDCNGNGIVDACDVDPADPDGDELVSPDCNSNGVPDECDIGVSSTLLGGPWDTELYFVDLLTGGLTLALDFDLPSAPDYCVYGMSVAPDGTLYVLGDAYGAYLLHTLDLETGDAVDIGGFAYGYKIADIAFTADGTLYGVAGKNASLMAPGQLAIISTEDGSITLTDIFGTAGGGQSIAAVPGTSLLYHVASEGEGYPGGPTTTVLEVIDVATEEVTLIADTLTNRYQALAYDPLRDQLFGASGGWDPEHGSLYAIDPATGAETYIGETGRVLLGLTFAPPVSADENGNGIPDECEFTPGDCNCDGLVDFFDIDPFIMAVTQPELYEETYPECNIMTADTNGDGLVDFFDIDSFVALVTGGG